jgi:hypothetical protein
MEAGDALRCPGARALRLAACGDGAERLIQLESFGAVVACSGLNSSRVGESAPLYRCGARRHILLKNGEVWPLFPRDDGGTSSGSLSFATDAIAKAPLASKAVSSVSGSDVWCYALFLA